MISAHCEQVKLEGLRCKEQEQAKSFFASKLTLTVQTMICLDTIICFKVFLTLIPLVLYKSIHRSKFLRTVFASCLYFKRLVSYFVVINVLISDSHHLLFNSSLADISTNNLNHRAFIVGSVAQIHKQGLQWSTVSSMPVLSCLWKKHFTAIFLACNRNPLCQQRSKLRSKFKHRSMYTCQG